MTILGNMSAPQKAEFAAAISAVSSFVTTIDTITPAPVAGVVSLNRPLLAGKAPPYAIVQIDLNGVVIGSATASSAGRWTYQIPAQINGNYTVLARGPFPSAPISFAINDPLQPLSDYLGRPALFDMNNAAGIYYGNGTIFASASDLLSSVGATVSGVRASFGGVEDTINPVEYFTTPTFDTNPTLASGNGFTTAVAGGQLQVTVSSATSAFLSYALTGYKGRAFRFSGEWDRNTVAANLPTLAHSLANSGLGGNLTLSAAITTPLTLRTIYGSAAVTGASYWGLRGTNTANGLILSDNWALREAMPLAGWAAYAAGDPNAAAPGWSMVVDTPLPTPPASGSKVVAQADTGSENHRVTLSLDSTGALKFTVAINNTVNANILAAISLGSGYVSGARVRVVAAVVQGTNNTESGIVASVNGGPSVFYNAADANMPGVAFIRLGQDSLGTSLFDGTYNQVAFLRDRAPADWCEATARLDDTMIALGGDSYVDGANNIGLRQRFAARGTKYANIAQGGSTLASQASRYASKPYLRKLRFVHWDGSDNGFTSITDDLAKYQAMWDAQGTGRTLFISPLAVPNPGTASTATPTAQATRCAQRTAALIAQFGAAHVFDPLPVLQGLGTGSADDNNDIASGQAPRSTLFDTTNGQVHLSSAAMTAVENALWASGKMQAL